MDGVKLWAISKIPENDKENLAVVRIPTDQPDGLEWMNRPMNEAEREALRSLFELMGVGNEPERRDS
jgi:hypothetical protein